MPKQSKWEDIYDRVAGEQQRLIAALAAAVQDDGGMFGQQTKQIVDQFVEKSQASQSKYGRSLTNS